MRFDVVLAVLGALAVATGVGAQSAGSTTSIDITSGGLSRNFLLYTPNGWTPSSPPIPILLNFHGLTSNPEAQQSYSRTNTEADQYDWAIAYPRGIGNSFNAGPFCCGDAAANDVDDVQFARDIVSHVGTLMNIDTSAVFSTGFSNGGYMTHRLACDAADFLRGAAPNSGRSFGCSTGGVVPMVSFTGTSDNVVPYSDYARDLSRRLTENGCNSTAMQHIQVTASSYCELYTDCQGDESFVEWCTIEGGGHTWFFGPNDIDSSAYMFERFEQILDGTYPGAPTNPGTATTAPQTTATTQSTTTTGQSTTTGTQSTSTEQTSTSGTTSQETTTTSPLTTTTQPMVTEPPSSDRCEEPRSGVQHQSFPFGDGYIRARFGGSPEACCGNCEDEDNCESYTHLGSFCFLYSTPVDGTVLRSGYTSGNKASDPMTPGAIGGISAAAAVVLLGGAGGVAYYKRKKGARKHKSPAVYGQNDQVELGAQHVINAHGAF